MAPVFDVSGKILLVQVSPDRTIPLEHKEISGSDNLSRIRILSCLGIEILVCGAISRLWHDIHTAWGIQVISYVAGPWDRVLQALMEGKLDFPEFCMPGCPVHMQTRKREAIRFVDSIIRDIDPAALQ